jgi:hypothetical protein
MSEKITLEATSAKSSSDETGEETVQVSNYITKLDWRLIPVLGCTYTILFLDRTNSTSLLPLNELQEPPTDHAQLPMRGLKVLRRA